MPTKILPQDIGSGVDFSISEVSLSNGTVSLPSLAFANDQTTGLFLNSAGDMRIAVSGAQQGIFSAGGFFPNTKVAAQSDGTAAAPFYTFSADSDTGLYHIGSNNLGISTNGAKILDISTTTLAITNDSAQLSLSRPTNGRTGYVTLYDSFGGLHLHGAPNGAGEGTSIAMYVTSDSPTALTPLMTMLGNGKTIISNVNTNPTSYLHVEASGSGVGDGLLLLRSTNTVTNTTTGIKIETGISSGTIGATPFLHFQDGGSDVFKMVGAAGLLQAKDGSAATPIYSFLNDTDTGFYRPGANSVVLSLGGTAQWDFNANGAIRGQSSTTNLLQPGYGSVSTPGHGFTGDEDTGMYRSGSNQISFAAGGVQIGFLDTSRGLGKILQVEEFSSNTQTTVNTTTMTDTGLSGSFTAKRSDSVIIIHVLGFVSAGQTGSGGGGADIDVTRDGSSIIGRTMVNYVNVGTGATIGHTAGRVFETTVPDTSAHTYTVRCAETDHPGFSTTSAVWGGDATTAVNTRMTIFEVALL